MAATRGFSLLHKGLILLAVPVCFQVLFVGLIAYLRESNAREQSWSLHSMRVQHDAQTLLQSLLDVLAYGRGYLLSGDADFLRRAREVEADIPKQLAALERQVADNPGQVERLPHPTASRCGAPATGDASANCTRTARQPPGWA